MEVIVSAALAFGAVVLAFVAVRQWWTIRDLRACNLSLRGELLDAERAGDTRQWEIDNLTRHSLKDRERIRRLETKASLWRRLADDWMEQAKINLEQTRSTPCELPE